MRSFGGRALERGHLQTLIAQAVLYPSLVRRFKAVTVFNMCRGQLQTSMLGAH